MSCVKIISIKPPAAAMMSSPASCPALVKFVIEIKTEIKTGMLSRLALTPNAKETDKYPSPIGKPSAIPFLNE